ncbi:XRE family transcriptional regulator [Streptomyces sp. RKND-216]|uniref:helix-turn-helix domain-containing protein n=1 Tax=Streptomyces sp. RKND-216 TaxID=2562581 RepID=UPI00109DCA36|nr:helix-turn-helix transcriptional regulator [Streptomyces sp. RKND-216]THA25690.1 XRE family transcriptional regulator [Streptomyces sp. RKND-216]
MGLRTHPTQRQRRLGAELRRLRLESGLSAIEAGEHVQLGGPHLSHIEAGRTAIPETKLRSLASLYGCKSATYVDALAEMATAKAGWWRTFTRHVDARARDLAELEATAVGVYGFETVHMPGLLQTPEYAMALIGSFTDDADAAERFYEFRLRRQEVLIGPSAPHYHAVIHEAALQMRYVDTDILRRQLTHLIEVSALPHVTVQIVPFRSGLLPAVGGPFVLFRGPDRRLDTVYLEHDVGSEFLHEPEHLARYDEIFDSLSTLALPPLRPAAEREFTSERDSLSLVQHLLYVL